MNTAAQVVGLQGFSLKRFLPLVRVTAMLLQVGIVIGLLGAAAIPPAWLVQFVFDRFGLTTAAIALPFGYALWGVCFCALVILAKHLIFPRTPTGSYPFYSTVVVRWAFVTQLAKVAHQMFLIWVIGTDIIAWWFSLLGARIGKRVTINTVFIYDWDILEIGDDCFIGGRSTVMCHIGQAGRVTFSATTLGAKCTLGQDTCVFCGVVMEDRSVVGANSLVLRNERLRKGTTYLGVPAIAVSERKPSGGKAETAGPVFLDRNENNFPPAPACISVLQSAQLDLLTRYSRNEPLAEKLSEWLGVERNRVVTGAGAEAVLKNAFASLVQPGDSVVLPGSSWAYYDDLANEAGARVSYYELEDRGDHFYTSSDAIIQCARRDNARVVLIASPNNPTGNCIDLAHLREVISALPDSYVILDEAYWGYSSKSNEYAAALVREFPNLLIVRSFSKFFGMPGLRMGYGITGSNLQGFARKSWVYLGQNRLAEAVAVAAIDSIDHFSGIAREVEIQKRILSEALVRLDGVTCYKSSANFLLARMRPSVANDLRFRAEQAGVNLKYFSEGSLASCTRITVGNSAQTARVVSLLDSLAVVAA